MQVEFGELLQEAVRKKMYARTGHLLVLKLQGRNLRDIENEQQFHNSPHVFPRSSLRAAPPVSYKKMGPPMIRYQ